MTSIARIAALTLQAEGLGRRLADAEKQRLIRTRSLLSKDVAAPV